MVRRTPVVNTLDFHILTSSVTCASQHGVPIELTEYRRHVRIALCYVCFYYRQLFALYETLPEPSVKKMEVVVNTGINIVALVYFSVSH